MIGRNSDAKGIWLFGAGEWGEKYVKEYGSSLCRGFVDNSRQKQGTCIRGVVVYSYIEFQRYFDRENDVIYITTYSGRNEILLQLYDDKLYEFVKVYIPDHGIADIKDSWNRNINSQLGEEVGLMHWFKCNGLLGGYKGFYLDIGAYHPFAGNNTRWAHKLGWRGMNIDPNEQSIRLFDIFRPDDINLNCGVSDTNGELLYHIFRGREAENSFVGGEKSSEANIRTVKVYNINEMLEKYHIEKIDFIDIDTEGFDEKIVQAFNWKKYSPKCALIELLGMGSVEDVLQTTIHKKMKEEGYFLKSFYTVTALYIKL